MWPGAHIQYCLALAWLCSPAAAYAQLKLRVQSDTQLGVRGDAEATGIRLKGRLSDTLGAPIPGARVQLRAERVDAPAVRVEAGVRSDANGDFQSATALPRGEWQVEAEFNGNTWFLPSNVRTSVSPARAGVRLSWRRAPTVFEANANRHPVEVHASTSADPAGLTINLMVGDQELATSQTGPDGIARLLVLRASLPHPTGTLTAVTTGDRARAGATISHPYVRQEKTTLSLSAARDPGNPFVTVDGRLHRASEALAEQAIGLYADDRHIVTLVTDEHGRFDANLEDRIVFSEDGQASHLEARFLSDALTLAHATSHRIRVVRPEPPPSRIWLLGALLLPVLWYALRRRTPDPAGRPAAGPVTGSSVQRGTSRGLGRDTFVVSGQVLQAETDAPLPHAPVTLCASPVSPNAVTLTADTTGHFSSERLAPGRYELCVEQDGYEALRLGLDVPHRGEWTGMRLRLRNLRDIAWQGYAPVARAIWGDGNGIPTARETLQALQLRRNAGESATLLCRQLEHAVYGPRPPGRGEVNEIVDRSMEALEELTGQPPK